MSVRKLYKATAEVVVFFESDEDSVDFDAEDFLRQGIQDGDFEHLHYEEVTSPTVCLDGWQKQALIYGTEKDKTLGEALAEIKP